VPRQICRIFAGLPRGQFLDSVTSNFTRKKVEEDEYGIETKRLFFATPLGSHYSKGEEQFDTSIFIFHRWKGKTYAE